jgi:hypothetical protein
VDAYTKRVVEAGESWRDEHESSALFHVAADDKVLVLDTRSCAAAASMILEGLEREVLLRCDDAHSVRSLSEELQADQLSIKESDIGKALDKLIDARLMVEDSGRFLSRYLWGLINHAAGQLKNW